MNTLQLESCRNKFDKKPWLAELKLASDGKELIYNFIKADDVRYISGTRNEYTWELEEDVVYSKGDTVNYSNYRITNFIIENGKERELTKKEVRELLSNE
ncbi:hypothetical protein [Burkholderia cepacia]|uniref:hypothetical protein n=1 Tax=Burkholderia cepacia TaxID=292 RepID=UPI00158B400E|nr:hypothetical protein [Burkholderia cepacia]